MHNFHPVDISCRQLIQRYHIFRIVVFDFEEIGNLPIRFLWQPAAHLNVDTLVALHRHKINLFRFIFPDINFIAPPPQFKIHDVFRQAAAAGWQREGQRMELRVGGQNMSSYIEIKNVSKSFGGRQFFRMFPCSQNREQLLAWLALTAAESRCCSRLYME